MTSRAVLVLLLLAAVPLAADDSRERWRRMRPQPLGPAAADPQASARDILERDPRFAQLLASRGSAWREDLARRSRELADILRANPLRIAPPRPSLPSLPSAPTSAPAFSWNPFGYIPELPAIPWRGLASSRGWLSLNSPLPRVPWRGLPPPIQRGPGRAPVAPGGWSWSWPSLPRLPRVPWRGLPSPNSTTPAPSPATPAATTASASESPFQAVPWLGLVMAPTRGPSHTKWPARLMAWTIAALLASNAFALLYLFAYTALVVWSALMAWGLLDRTLSGAIWLLALPMRWRARRSPAHRPSGAASGTVSTANARVIDAPAAPLRLPDIPVRRAWNLSALELFEAGHAREALRELVLLVLSALDRRGAIRYERTLTNWDYRRQLPVGATRDAYGELCRLFDRAWYGERALEPDAFERACTLGTSLVEPPR